VQSLRRNGGHAFHGFRAKGTSGFRFGDQRFQIGRNDLPRPRRQDSGDMAAQRAGLTSPEDLTARKFSRGLSNSAVKCRLLNSRVMIRSLSSFKASLTAVSGKTRKPVTPSKPGSSRLLLNPCKEGARCRDARPGALSAVEPASSLFAGIFGAAKAGDEAEVSAQRIIREADRHS